MNITEWPKDLLKRRKVVNAYKLVFDGSEESNIVLRDLCDIGGVFDGGFHRDPAMRDFRAGERNMVLRILTLLKMNPEDITQMAEVE